MIFDCFQFRGDGPEMDLLEFRLTHMQDYDVTHILTESGYTHSGVIKPLLYQACRKRFAAWADRITALEAELPAGTQYQRMSPWVREHYQRDQAAKALGDADPYDLVLISDLDEIPDMPILAAEASHLERNQLTRPSAVQQRIFAFAVDWEFPWLELTSVTCGAGLTSQFSLSGIRDARSSYDVLEEAGWHFSWLGGSEGIRAKTRAHCHSEYDTRLLQGADTHVLYEQGIGVWGFNLMPAEVDETYPEYIRKGRCPADWFRPH